ncbi:MAG: hypothetical protein AAFU67_13355, partial [Bacteroidota bacterium]
MSPHMTFNFKSLLPHIVAIATFLAVLFYAYTPALNGRVVSQSDIVSNQAMAKEANDYQKKTGDRALWTNGIFSGMPTFQINLVSDGNQLKHVSNISQGYLPNPIGMFFAAMLCAYIMLVLLGVNPWLSIIGALAFGMATNNVILFEAGHNTKVRAVAYFPLIVAGIVLAFRKKYLIGGLIFALGMGLAIYSNHPQMVYYLGLTIPIFGVAALIDILRQKEWPHLGKAVGILLIGLF